MSEVLSLEVIAVDLGGGRRLWRQEAGSIISRKKRRERSSLRAANESRFAWSNVDEYWADLWAVGSVPRDEGRSCRWVGRRPRVVGVIPPSTAGRRLRRTQTVLTTTRATTQKRLSVPNTVLVWFAFVFLLLCSSILLPCYQPTTRCTTIIQPSYNQPVSASTSS